MARIRTIKPEFPQSESMGRVSRDARLLFVLLWTLCDDCGRTRAASRMLASLLFPYDDDAPKRIDGWLEELERENCVRRYVVEGDTYLEILNWLKHQKIDRPSPSKIPAFDASSRILANPRESSSLDQGPRTKDQGKEETSRASRSDRVGLNGAFTAFWDAYPRKKSKGQAERAWLKIKPDEQLSSAILAAVERAKTSADWQRDGGQFIPHPATWLNAKGWEDVVGVSTPSGPRVDV